MTNLRVVLTTHVLFIRFMIQKRYFHPMNNSRRAFLKQSMLGASTMMAPFSILSFDDRTQLRVALVGLGRYAGYMAEAITESKKCTVSALVTGTPEKRKTWGDKYKVPERNIYNYENFDQIAHNPEIDLVYILLPNAMHKEFAIRAANAGKHVLVEKPMAISAQECEEIIAACIRNKVQLAVGYRLHFEPYNQEMMRLGQQKIYGQVKLLEASLGYAIDFENPLDWHISKDLAGGGPLLNLGVYCVQAARYITGEEPISVTAQFAPVTRPEVFKEVEEAITWQLHFGSGAVATSSTSYSCGVDRLFASAEQGNFELSPAISYGPFKGKSPAGDFRFEQTNQLKVQMDQLAPYFLANKPVPEHISGIEGLKDLKVIDAIYKAALSNKKIMI